MKKNTLRSILILSSFVIFACVTVNIYFPAAAVGKAADVIVEDVWEKEEENKDDTTEQEPEDWQKPESEPETTSGSGSLIQNSTVTAILNLFSTQAHAETDINISTPTIRALKNSMKKRAPSIFPYLNKGNVGLSNRGYLVIRSKKNLSLQEVSRMKKLVSDDNSDRKSLYREIARANNINMDRIDDIESIFAKSWIKNARSGWIVQGADGKWRKKK